MAPGAPRPNPLPYAPPPHLGAGFGGAPYGPPKATDGKAIASIALGAASVVTCTGALAGVPAIILGAIALREINRPESQVEGRGLAIGGIVIGAISTFVTLAWFGMILFAIPKTFGGLTPPIIPTAYTAPNVEQEYVGTVEVHRAQGPNLTTILVDESTTAHALGRVLVVQTTGIASCPRACLEVRRALNGAAMQTLFTSQAMLLEVSLERYQSELEKLGIPTYAAPMFFLVNTDGTVQDLISADEWDENTASNMAPVLEAFADGLLTKRRVPNPRVLPKLGMPPESPADDDDGEEEEAPLPKAPKKKMKL